MSGSSELDFSPESNRLGHETSFKPAGLWYASREEAFKEIKIYKRRNVWKPVFS